MMNNSDGKGSSANLPSTPNVGNNDNAGRQSLQRNRGFKKHQSGANIIEEPKFEGRINELNGHIYDCSYKQADTYTRTTKEIAMYIGRNFKFGNDSRIAIQNLRNLTFTLPDGPDKNASRSELRVWEKEVDDHVRRKTTFKENMKSAYAIVWG
jgi:hypothetical protein